MNKQQIKPEQLDFDRVPKRKKAGWLSATFWMLAMMLLGSLFMATLAYFIAFYKQ
ncbi:MAG: hypothetical protein R8K20_04615 [Gallionellaceae bacterium]